MIVPRGTGALRRGMGADPTIVSQISAAIKRQENVNPAYNNPGGLIAAPGCTSRPGQIAICPDAATGEAGLERQVGIDIDRGWTLNQLINSWAPACADPICQGNNPSAYSQNVSTWTGLPQDVPLSSLDVGTSSDNSTDSLLPDFSALAGDSSGWMWVGVIGIGILAVIALDR